MRIAEQACAKAWLTAMAASLGVWEMIEFYRKSKTYNRASSSLTI